VVNYVIAARPSLLNFMIADKKSNEEDDGLTWSGAQVNGWS